MVMMVIMVKIIMNSVIASHDFGVTHCGDGGDDGNDGDDCDDCDGDDGDDGDDDGDNVESSDSFSWARRDTLGPSA